VDERQVRSKSPISRAVRFTLVGLGAVAVPPAVGRAEKACTARLVPDDAGPAWGDALREARARLARLGPHHDCRAVEIVVGLDGGATLSFLTTDGRGTARALETPSDLMPTLEALLVTLPPGEPAAAASVFPSASASPDRPPSAPPAPAAPDVDRRASTLNILASAVTGGRVAWGPVTYTTPSFAFRPSVALGRWEIGVFAEHSPVYHAVKAATPEGFSLSSFGTGMFLGRRERVSAFNLGYGMTLGVSGMSEEATSTPGSTTSRAVDAAQPRVGGYGKGSYPATWPVRLAVEADLDTALGRLRSATTKERDLPGLPRVAFALSLGVEVMFQ
jgi:hypothetical protein